jgi:hypothetical protein
VAGDAAVKRAFTVTVSTSADWIANKVGDIALAIGPELARAAAELERRRQLGHYPALDYLRGRANVDPGLFATMDHVAAIVGELIGAELRDALRPLCSHVEIDRILATAYALPRVRPGAAGAVERLARHYTPDTVRIDLLTTLRPRQLDRGPAAAAALIRETLAPRFAAVDVTPVPAVPGAR